MIKNRYQEIFDNLSLSISLDEDFAEIVGKLTEGASLDYAASRGEYLNARVMAEYLGFPFVDAEDLIFFPENPVISKKRRRWRSPFFPLWNMRLFPVFTVSMKKGKL